MIWSEACRVRDANWQVGENRESSIQEARAKGEIVADFMNG
jgi:hypothetical protein